MPVEREKVEQAAERLLKSDVNIYRSIRLAYDGCGINGNHDFEVDVRFLVHSALSLLHERDVLMLTLRLVVDNYRTGLASTKVIMQDFYDEAEQELQGDTNGK